MVMSLLVGIAGSIIASILWNEADKWAPRVARRLLDRAVRKLPSAIAPRYAEEWSAYLDDMPTSLSMLFAAIGFGIAAERIRLPGRLRLRYAIDKVLAASALITIAPLMIVVSAVLLIVQGRPVLARSRRRSGDRAIDVLRFRTVVAEGGHGRLAAGVSVFLRRSSLDELPQLFNVLRGELTFVGTQALPLPIASIVDFRRGRSPDHLERAGIAPFDYDDIDDDYDRPSEEEYIDRLVRHSDDYRRYVEAWSLRAEVRSFWRLARSMMIWRR